MKVFDYLETALKVAAGVSLALVFVFVTAQVAFRYFLGIVAPSTSEFAIYAMIWTIFLGSAVAFRQKEHIAMEILLSKSTGNLRLALSIFVFLCLALFLGVLVHSGFNLSQAAMRQLSPSSKIPVGYIASAIPICSALALIFVTEAFVKEIIKVKTPQ